MAAKCNVCNIRRPQTGSKGSETSPHNDMCNYCFEEGGQENTHSDQGHDDIAAGAFTLDNTSFSTQEELDKFLDAERDVMATCWICHPELNLAQKPAKAGNTGPKTQGTRRPQLNHKGHSHPGTPAARRACKALFWAQSTVKAEQWDARLDGHGKALPAPTPQATPMTVVPRGPKGGVINQLKKGKPSSK
jgi:hypothetical protein